MNPVTVITDSTAYLPANLVASLNIEVIPLTVNWDGQSYRDGVDITAEDFYRRLATSSTLPTTSQISEGVLCAGVNAVLARGHDALLLPISSGISSTFQTAEAAMGFFPAGRVALIDTKLVSMALGFMVLAAARAAQAGASLAECKTIAQQSYEHIGVYFTVDTLKYLAAGGRINSAKRLVGSALNIKPLLEIRDGKIELVTSVVSRRKALERMLELVEKGIDGRTPVRLSVFHALEREAAEALMEVARARFSPVECLLSEVSPVVGAHVGPGTLSIAYQAG